MGTGVISAAIQKQNIIRCMTDGAIFGAASAFGNFGATNLGEAYNYGDGQIGYVQHKLGHLALGGALGAIISKERLKGALIGGLSAGGAEIVAEALMGDVQAQVIDLREAGFTDDQSRDHIMKLARFNGEFSKLASASIAAASNNNVTTALFTASNAIENNFYHTDFFRRDITFGTETIGGPLGGSPQRGNRFAQQNKGATQNATPTEASKNPANYNSKAGDLATPQGSSKAARREAMRQDGIPTSQQPNNQINTPSGRQLSYDVPKPGGGTKTKIVTQQTTDRVPGHGPHWESGDVKIPKRTDPLGRLRVVNDKKKVEYDNVKKQPK